MSPAHTAPNFTPENGIAPDDSVPVVGAGLTALALIFKNGSIVPIQSREFADARAELAKFHAVKVAIITDEQKRMRLQQDYALRQRVERARRRMLAAYGVTETAGRTYVIDQTKFPALVHAWRESLAAKSDPVLAAVIALRTAHRRAGNPSHLWAAEGSIAADAIQELDRLRHDSGNSSLQQAA